MPIAPFFSVLRTVAVTCQINTSELPIINLIQDLGNKPLETLHVQLYRGLMRRIDFAKIKMPILSLVWFHATTCVAVSKFRIELDWGSYVSFCLALAAILSCCLLHSWGGLLLKGCLLCLCSETSNHQSSFKDSWPMITESKRTYKIWRRCFTKFRSMHPLLVGQPHLYSI